MVVGCVDGGCQDLPSELKNTKTDLGGGSYGQVGGGVGLIRGGANTRGCEVRVLGVGWAKWLGGAGARWFEVQAPSRLSFGRKFGGNANFGGFHGGKGGDCWGGARSTCQTSNPWTKTTKSHKIQQIARKFFGAIFVGIFEFGRKTTKSS